jgi:hypothetical protein
MLMVLVVSFSVLLLTAFCVKTKHLHLFELLAIWFTVTAVNALVYTYFLVNKHWITVPDSNKELALVRITWSLILNPIIITWILDKVLLLKHFIVRLLCYIATLGVLFLGGWTFHVFGVARFVSVGLLWYIPFKSIVLIMALCSVWMIRLLIRSDGI